MGRLGNVLVLAGAVVLGDDGAAADGNAHEQVDDQIDDGAVGTDGGQSMAAYIPPHHDDVGGIEQQLQNAGGHQRQREQKDLLRQAAGTHIYFIFMACSSQGKQRSFSGEMSFYKV